MGPLPAAIIKTLAPIIVDKIARKLSKKKKTSAAPGPVEIDEVEVTDFDEPLIDEATIDEIVREIQERPDVAEAIAPAPKPWWQSQGVLAGLCVTALSAAGVFGAAVTADDLAEITRHADKIVISILGIVAVWGRIKARKRIG